MRNVNQENLTQVFLDYCGPETSPRLRFLLEHFVNHLHETGGLQRQANQETAAGYLQQLKDAGMEVIEDIDSEPFKAIVKEPVWSAFVEDNEGGQEYIDRILALQPKS